MKRNASRATATVAAVALMAAALMIPGGRPAARADQNGAPPSGAKPAPSAEAKPDAKPGANWRLFRGDVSATGVSATTLPSDPKLLWKYRVPKGAFEATPAIVDGVVYIGDLDGRLLALNLADGEKKWEQQSDTGYMASPAVQNNRIYLGDIDGVFHCFDATDGSEIWKLEAEAEIDSSANFYKDQVLFGSQDATLYCADAKTGELTWKHQIEDQIRCSPTIVGSRGFVAGCDAKLHVIDLDTGKKISDVEINAPTGSTPAVVGSFAYFGTEGGEVLGIDWKAGQVAWRFSSPGRAMPFRGSPAATDELIVVGGRDKRLYGLKPIDGTEKWSYLAKHRIDSSPVVVGDRAYFGSADGRVQAVDLATGKEAWTYEAGGSFTGSPAVADQRLVIASDDGVVYCFGEPSP